MDSLLADARAAVMERLKAVAGIDDLGLRGYRVEEGTLLFAGTDLPGEDLCRLTYNEALQALKIAADEDLDLEDLVATIQGLLVREIVLGWELRDRQSRDE